MRNKFVVVSSVALIASAMAYAAAAQTSLPANIQADRATVQQDATNLHNTLAQLQADERAGNATAVAADRTAVRLARMQLGLDFGKLHQDALGTLQQDQAALMAALTQLHADQVANNATAVQSDRAAVESADTLLKNDRTAIFGDLGDGFGMHRRHGRG